jgi:hypothetical protein
MVMHLVFSQLVNMIEAFIAADNGLQTLDQATIHVVTAIVDNFRERKRS